MSSSYINGLVISGAYLNGESTLGYFNGVKIWGGGPVPVPAPSLTLISGNPDITVKQSTSITPIVYEWANADTVEVTNLHTGLTATVDDSTKRVTISGSPTSTDSKTFTVTTVGGEGDAATMSGTINVIATYKLLQSVQQTKSMTNTTQTLGSSINFADTDYTIFTIKFGATNNRSGAGNYGVTLKWGTTSGGLSKMRWHASYVPGRAPLCTDRAADSSITTVSKSGTAVQTSIDGAIRWYTSANTYTSGTWASYRVTIDIVNKKFRIAEINKGSYVEGSINKDVTGFLNVWCNGDGTGMKSAIRNLSVYGAVDWATAITL